MNLALSFVDILLETKHTVPKVAGDIQVKIERRVGAKGQRVGYLPCMQIFLGSIPAPYMISQIMPKAIPEYRASCES